MVPWVEVEVDASNCHNADEVYDSLRAALGALLAEGKERLTALRVRIAGGTDTNNELNRDPEQIRNEGDQHQLTSVATACCGSSQSECRDNPEIGPCRAAEAR